MAESFASFREFYPFYLSEHANRTCRRLHFVGTSLVIACLVALALTGNAWWILAALLCGYGFAWVGHFFFEHNRPATFRHPFYSFIGDWVMYRDMLTGRIPVLTPIRGVLKDTHMGYILDAWTRPRPPRRNGSSSA